MKIIFFLQIFAVTHLLQNPTFDSNIQSISNTHVFVLPGIPFDHPEHVQRGDPVQVPEHQHQQPEQKDAGQTVHQPSHALATKVFG